MIAEMCGLDRQHGMEKGRFVVHYTAQEYESLGRLVHTMANPLPENTDLPNNTAPDLAGGAVLVADSHLVRIRTVAALDERTETVKVATWRLLIDIRSLSEL